MRADRQPEFTQIDCEMSFVERDDLLDTFEGLVRHLFKSVKGLDITSEFPRLLYEDSLENYGTDKPDIRFDMKIKDITDKVKGKGFMVLDKSEYTGGICAEGCCEYSRKQLDELTGFVQKPQIGAKGLISIKYNTDDTFKSSIEKFYTQDDMRSWAKIFDAKPGDLILILAGEKARTLNALSELRLEMAERLGLREKNTFAPLWIIDFPLLEWNEESKRFHAMHHPFTSPKIEDINKLETDPGNVKANAYDLVINGVELGGGSIRIHDRDLQQEMFKALGFTDEEATRQFGFLMNAFRYGAPPHGGIAFGFDRCVALFAGLDSIRDVIPFPKNNAGRDVMIDSPSAVSEEQLKELSLKVSIKK